MSLFNGDKIQGSQNPEHNIFTSGLDISTKSIQTQFKIMKRAVAKCPKVNVTIMGENMPLLLDSGSVVNLMWQTYFHTYFKPWLGSAEGAMAGAHIFLS